jgi:hypothetical protein
MVIAPARTGKDKSSKMVVMNTDQTNKGTRSISMLLGRMFMIVVIKLIEPRILDTPAKCKEKMAKSTAPPLWEILPAKGGYTVHPVPAPDSTIEDLRRRSSDGGSNQNLILFIRGKAISGADTIIGTNQLPNPPIKAGITIKKIITNAWAVTITL